MNAILKLIIMLGMLSLAWAQKKLPCATDADKVAVYKVVKSCLSQSNIPDALKKRISPSTIKGYERRFPKRLVVFLSDAHIVTLNQTLQDEKMHYSLSYSPRGSYKAKVEKFKTVMDSYNKLIEKRIERRNTFGSSSHTSPHVLPLEYINALSAKKMWTHQEAYETFPAQYKKLIKREEKYISHYLYVNDNFLVKLSSEKRLYFSMLPLVINEDTIVTPRERVKSTGMGKNHFFIPDSMVETLRKEGTLEKAQIMAKHLNERMENEWRCFIIDQNNKQDMEYIFGKIFDTSFVVYGEIPAIEKDLSALEISVLREMGHYFNSLLELEKVGLEASFIATDDEYTIQITNENGDILKSSRIPVFYKLSGYYGHSFGARSFTESQSRYHAAHAFTENFPILKQLIDSGPYLNEDDARPALRDLGKKWREIVLHSKTAIQKISDQESQLHIFGKYLLAPRNSPSGKSKYFDFKKFIDESTHFDENYNLDADKYNQYFENLSQKVLEDTANH